MLHTYEPLTVRRAHAGDSAALAALAALDSAPIPQAPALIAEVGGRLLAALPLAGGPAVADPFLPTAELVALLRLRAQQLEAGRRRQHPLRRLLRPRPAAV